MPEEVRLPDGRSPGHKVLKLGGLAGGSSVLTVPVLTSREPRVFYRRTSVGSALNSGG